MKELTISDRLLELSCRLSLKAHGEDRGFLLEASRALSAMSIEVVELATNGPAPTPAQMQRLGRVIRDHKAPWASIALDAFDLPERWVQFGIGNGPVALDLVGGIGPEGDAHT